MSKHRTSWKKEMTGPSVIVSLQKHEPRQALTHEATFTRAKITGIAFSIIRKDTWKKVERNAGFGIASD